VPHTLGSRADHTTIGAGSQLHDVVGDEPVAARNELERALALADAAAAEQQTPMPSTSTSAPCIVVGDAPATG
jgi:hypothetical protein